MPAIIHQINVSDGGVPKTSVANAFVNVRGVLGDTQADRKHHGRPIQALCLFSLEVITALQGEGHPIQPGDAGENLTISGLDWAALSPGMHLRIGSTVIAEITGPAIPCAKNAQWFADRDHQRISHDEHPGWSRWYASVLAAGPIAPGDRVEIVAPA